MNSMTRRIAYCEIISDASFVVYFAFIQYRLQNLASRRGGAKRLLGGT